MYPRRLASDTSLSITSGYFLCSGMFGRVGNGVGRASIYCHEAELHGQEGTRQAALPPGMLQGHETARRRQDPRPVAQNCDAAPSSLISRSGSLSSLVAVSERAWPLSTPRVLGHSR